MKKYLFIILLIGVCFADTVLLKNGKLLSGLVIGIKDNSILFQDENTNRFIFLQTETIDNLYLSNGEKVFDSSIFTISDIRKEEYLEKYKYFVIQEELNEKYYSSNENLVAVGFVVIISILMIKSLDGSKKNNDNSGFWNSVTDFWNGLVND